MPLFLLSLSAITSVLGPSNGTLLVQVPMIMVHDSGSGYLPEKGVVNKWARTQSVGMAQQLECGARAFDARPLRKEGKTIWHHGSVAIDYLYTHTLNDITAWLRSNPGQHGGRWRRIHGCGLRSC